MATGGPTQGQSGAGDAGVAAPNGATTAILLSTGFEHSCALKNDGTVWCWGNNEQGQLGDGTTTDSLTPVAVTGLLDVVSLSKSQFRHICAVKSDGTLWCWGKNDEGELGNGSAGAAVSTPVAVRGLTGVIGVATGMTHTCAVKGDGTVWCWGQNSFGDLGMQPDTLIPVQMSAFSDATAVVTGVEHTCALKSDKTVWCWGNDVHTPTQVTGFTGAVAIDASVYHTCALLEDGTVRCKDATTNPTEVPGLTDATAMTAAAGDRACAVKSDGTVWCQAMMGGEMVPVGLSDATAVSGGGGLSGTFHACALTTDGRISCWGDNTHGQLGDGTTTSSPSPVLVTDFSIAN